MPFGDGLVGKEGRNWWMRRESWKRIRRGGEGKGKDWGEGGKGKVKIGGRGGRER